MGVRIFQPRLSSQQKKGSFNENDINYVVMIRGLSARLLVKGKKD